MSVPPYEYGKQGEPLQEYVSQFVPVKLANVDLTNHLDDTLLFSGTGSHETAVYTELSTSGTINPYSSTSTDSEFPRTSTDSLANSLVSRANQPSESKLETLLKQYGDGKVIKRSYKLNNGFLTETARTLLVHLIIQSEVDKALATLSDDGVEKLNDFTISSATFISYAADIEKLFTTESCGTYYNAFKSVNGVRVLAHGKLWEHFSYIKGVLRQQGVLESRKPKLKDTNSVIVTDDIKLHLEWLKTNCEPWEELLDKWNSTFEARRQSIITGHEACLDNFSEVLAIRLQIGCKLLECDFNRLWPGRHSILFDTWEAVRKQLIFKIRGAKNIKSIEDKAYVHALPTLPEDQQTSVVFSLLPYLLPSERLKCRKRKISPKDNAGKENVISNTTANARKLSLLERKESFSIIVPTAADINTAIGKQKSYLLARGLTFQPAIVIVGSLVDIRAVHVVIDDIIYNTPSYLHAIDTTFKIFFAVNCEYPSECRSLWLFLQKAVYNIEPPTEKFPVAVTALAGEIKQILSSKT